MKRVEFRPSTISEREEFYNREFSLKKVIYWFKKNKLPLPKICALDAGTDTGIILEKKHKGNMLYFEFRNILKKIKEYAPEDIYYDRNQYKNPKEVINHLNFKKPINQELVFDLDVENIAEDITNFSLKKLFLLALKMKKELKRKFKHVHIVYSGRGFHIHVSDKKARKLTIKERKDLNKQFCEYPLDPWVSKGYIRLIRIPHTLNSLVSRISIPINNKFNENKTIPKFMLK